MEIVEVVRRHEIIKGLTPEKLCAIIEELGLTSTTGMKMSTYYKVVERLVEICTAHKAELEAEEGTKNDGAAEE